MPAENFAQKHVECEPCCLLSFMERQLVKHTVADEETPHDLKYSNAIVLSIWMSGCVGRGCRKFYCRTDPGLGYESVHDAHEVDETRFRDESSSESEREKKECKGMQPTKTERGNFSF